MQSLTSTLPFVPLPPPTDPVLRRQYDQMMADVRANARQRAHTHAMDSTAAVLKQHARANAGDRQAVDASEYDTDPSIRAKFPTKGSYVAYRRAVDAGHINVLKPAGTVVTFNPKA